MLALQRGSLCWEGLVSLDQGGEICHSTSKMKRIYDVVYKSYHMYVTYMCSISKSCDYKILSVVTIKLLLHGANIADWHATAKINTMKTGNQHVEVWQAA